MPGVGWAAGIERLAMLIAEPPAAPRPVALVPIGAEAEAFDAAAGRGFCAAGAGRRSRLFAAISQRRMRRADRIGARAAVMLGDDELARGAATLRDLDSGEQSEVPLDALAGRL